MSSAKRSRQRQPEPPAPKRQKTTPPSKTSTKDSLSFLVDENARAGRKLEAKLTNGIPNTKLNRAQDVDAIVTSGLPVNDEASLEPPPAEVIDISSAVEDSSSDEEEEELDEEAQNGPPEDTTVNGVGHTAGDVSMQDAAEAEDTEEQTFGELLQVRHPEPIDVQASLHSGDRASSSGARALSAPTSTSLGTVLTQALKTNDRDLLETCFHMTDRDSIRSTIERLHSHHVATLFQRIAERIHKRPGRASNLLVWIQWSLVAHGAYLATHQQTMENVKEMTKVIRDRASGLQPLLHLKGKLDMLSAQLDLRRKLHENSKRAYGETDDEDDVLYIEGRDDASESDVAPAPSKSTARTLKIKDIEASDDDSNDDMPNGLAQADEEEDDDDVDDFSDDEEDDEGLIDDEAEETSDDGSEEMDSDEEGSSEPASEDDDDEDMSDDDESDAAVKPVPLSSLQRKR